MKLKIAVLIFIGGACIVSADLLSLSNDQLVDKFKPGSNLTEFEEALGSDKAEQWIERFLSEDRLKRLVYSNLKQIKNDDLRDKTLIEYLKDDPYWELAYDSMHDFKGYMAEDVRDCIFMHFPKLKEDDRVRVNLGYSILSTQGRSALAVVLERYVKLTPDERGKSQPKTIEIEDQIRKVSNKYATTDYNMQGFRRKSQNTTQPSLPSGITSDRTNPQPEKIATSLVAQREVNKTPFFIGGGIFALFLALIFARRTVRN